MPFSGTTNRRAESALATATPSPKKRIERPRVVVSETRSTPFGGEIQNWRNGEISSPQAVLRACNDKSCDLLVGPPPALWWPTSATLPTRPSSSTAPMNESRPPEKRHTVLALISIVFRRFFPSSNL